ncbi:MAG: triple tyrosine motif-containing protein, partial [Cyclobacteriaceae bacterium]
MTKYLTLHLTVLLLCCLMPGISHAQHGSFIIDDHYRSSDHRDGIHFEIISDNNGLISVAHNQGIFQYDGAVWDYYHTPTAAISLTNDAENAIYVGCVNGFGRLDWVDYKVQYVPVYESEDTPELFFQAESVGDNVYYLSEKSLFVYNISEGKIIKSFKDSFQNLYVLDNQVYVNTEKETFLVEESVLKPAPTSIIQSKIASVISTIDKKLSVAMDFDGKIYRYEKENFTPFVINETIEAMDISLSDIQMVNDTLIAASTLDEGCIFLNIKSGDIEILDHSKGLADNEIFAIHTDVEGGLWVSHELGLSRILASFPAKSYAHLPGISGNLLSVQRTEEKLWFTSSAGVFYFDQDTTFRNKVYYIVKDADSKKADVAKKRKNSSRKRVVKPIPDEETGAVDESETSSRKKKKKGLLNRLFKKKKNLLKEQEGQAPQQKENVASAEQDQKQKPGFFKKIFGGQDTADGSTTDKVSGKLQQDKVYLRRTRRIPTGITHKYAKVLGSEGKTSELIRFNGQLLAVSTSGLFEINEDSAHLVIDEPIDEAIHLKGTNELLVLTYDQRIKLYALSDDIWVERKTFDPNDIIKDIYQDKEGNIWLAGSSEIFNVSVEEDEIIVKNEYDIDNYRFDKILMTSINDTTFFINTHGYFYLDKSVDQLRPYQKWLNKIGKPVNYFRDSQNFLWIYNGKTWFEISEIGTVVIHRYFGLFPGLRMITYDQVLDKYWLITGKNQLLAFDHTAESIDSTLHPLFLKKIKALNGVLQANDKLMINYDNTYLSFEMSKPDYLGLLNTEYKYKLEGMNDNWSEWSSNSKIDFSFLQPGKYTLHVMSRDSFGNSETADPISFTVRTPYWQTPWFYALQVILFGSLVLLSSRLNQLNTRNRILKSALTILTLVLIIEFLQSAMA